MMVSDTGSSRVLIWVPGILIIPPMVPTSAIDADVLYNI